MQTIEPRKSNTGFNVWHAMTHSFRAPGSLKFSLGFGAMAVLIMVLAYAIFGGLFFLAFGSSFESLSSGNTQNLSPGQTGLFFVGYIGFLVFAVFLAAIIEAGMHRRMLGLQTGGFPFRLGRDEWNVFLAILGVYGVIFVVMILAMIVVALISALLSAISPFLAIIPLLGVYVVLFAAMVRLSPAGALSVHQGRPHVLAALKVSKHRSWWILLTYFLMIVFFYAVIFFLMAIAFGPSAFSGGFSGDPGAFGGFSGFALAILVLGSMLFYVLAIPMMMGIGSYVVKHWNGGAGNEASVFD